MSRTVLAVDNEPLSLQIDLNFKFPPFNPGPNYLPDGGASDYMTPARVATAQELFSAAQFEEVPGAGHIVHLDQPEIFYTSLRSFLEMYGELEF